MGLGEDSSALGSEPLSVCKMSGRPGTPSYVQYFHRSIFAVDIFATNILVADILPHN